MSSFIIIIVELAGKSEHQLRDAGMTKYRIKCDIKYKSTLT